jgi:hypothetical protein
MNLFANNCNSAKISECFSVSKFKPTVIMMHTSPNKIITDLLSDPGWIHQTVVDLVPWSDQKKSKNIVCENSLKLL